MAQVGAQVVQAVQPLPVGTVIYDWPSNNIPAGWVATDGQAISRTTYANLFNVLGTTYGLGDGSTTFNVPKQSVSSDTGGRVSLPYQPFFSGVRNNGHVTNGVYILDQAVINRGSHYNTSTGTFTCPVAGSYMTLLSGLGWRTPGYGYIYIYKNGVVQATYGHWNMDAGGWANPSLLALVSCAANDTLQFHIASAGGNGGLYGGAHNAGLIAYLG